MATSTHQASPATLLKDIGQDLKTIAVDELELARGKMTNYLDRLVAKAGLILFGACVALIGLAMLCVVVVIALEPVLPALWLRLLIMSVIYMAIGGAAAAIFAKRLAHGPDLANEVDEVGQTFDAVKAGLEDKKGN